MQSTPDLRKILKMLWFLSLVFLAAFCIYLFLALQQSLGASPAGERLLRMQASPQFRDGRFRNTLPSHIMAPGSSLETLQQWFGDEQRVPPSPLPVVFPGAEAFAHKPESGLRLTWLGHVSFLVELDGQVILTDPVFGERASPLSWIGVKRTHPVPLTIADLPPLDAVVISHDHYDHLDFDSIRKLQARTKRFVVPLGIGAHLEHWGVPPDQILELDWWQEVALPGEVRLVATPARHYSGRFLSRDNTLWASWAFIGPRHRVYFGGDSGMDAEAFKAIGEKLGPFDFTLMKIGAYGKTWPDIHLTPEEALQAHALVKGKVFVPTHWATFNLAFHAWDEPVERLQATAQQHVVQLVVPKPGQPLNPKELPAVTEWWRDI